MPRTDEAAVFFTAVYRAVQEIPLGKVTTYGHIAKLVGTHSEAQTAQRPRQVGVCLKHLPADVEARFNHDNVPWQRVINAKGTISPSGWKYTRSQPSGRQNQAVALRAEGVEVVEGGLGELRVDLGEHGWFPDALPSEERDDSEDGNPIPGGGNNNN